jgi:hypothetical protein
MYDCMSMAFLRYSRLMGKKWFQMECSASVAKSVVGNEIMAKRHDH